jgi:regulator of sirC expression with transglutaminase-like and TPR domain
VTRRIGAWATCLAALAFAACLEKPDPASQALAILNKRPATFQDRLLALDRLASEESGLPGRTALAESLHHHALRLEPVLEAAAGDSERIGILNAFFFDSLGLAPLADDTTLASSLPSRVLADRKGGCLGLVLLYLALAERLELPLVPLFLPGHVALRWRSDSLVRNIETLRGGTVRSDSFYRATFSLARRPWYALADGQPDQALAALVFNLANLHLSRGEVAAAREEYRLVLERMPGYPEALGNLGAVLLKLGERDPARESLLAALAGDSLGDPARENLGKFFPE